MSGGTAAVACERLGAHHREQEQRKKRDAGNCQIRKRPAGVRRAPGEIEYPAHEQRPYKATRIAQHRMHWKGRAAALGTATPRRPPRQGGENERKKTAIDQ